MNRTTGERIEGDAHLAQSIADILTTPIGSRVMRRDYGSLLYTLIDAPMNAATRLLMFAATATALSRWEPRLRLTGVAIENRSASGSMRITIMGTRTDAPKPNNLVTLKMPLLFSNALSA